MQDLEFKIEKTVKIVSGDITDMELCDRLIEKIKYNIDPTLSFKTNVPHMTSFKRFNGDPDFHLFLKSIQSDIKKIYKHSFIIENSWGVLMNKGDSTHNHAHIQTSAFCGLLYLTTGGPGTSFEEIKKVINPIKGRYILFDPILLHFVNRSDLDKRYSLAFNMDQIKKWDNLDFSKKV